MRPAVTSVCRICGSSTDEEILIAGVGGICPPCLLAGRFLGSTSSLPLAAAAQALGEMSPGVQELLVPVIQEPETLARSQDFNGARDKFLQIAQNFLQEDRPLLAAHVLYRTLRLPGQSAEVYESLGQAAIAMDCEIEALQHFKTAGWLALKSGHQEVALRVLARVEELAPEDPWLKKHRESDTCSAEPGGKLCRFCGRPAEEVGELIEGSQASVCSPCVKRLMSLDG